MKKKIKIGIAAIGYLLYFMIVVLLVTTVREWIEVYTLGIKHFNKDYFLGLASIETFLEFLEPNMYNFFGWFVIGVGIISFCTNTIYRNMKKDKKYVDETGYGSHGTSRFQTVKEKNENYGDDKIGWFLGSSKEDKEYKLGMEGLYHPVKGELNMQMTVLGSPGSIKTTGFVLPNLFHLPYIYKKKGNGEMPDIIVTDPKSELYCLTANYLEEQGYDVRVLDFIHLKYGDTLNCIEFMETEKELMEISEGYISSVEASTGGGKGDGFWGEQEGQALGALIGAIKQTKPKDKHVFKEVLTFLTTELCNEEGAIDMYKSREYFENNVTGAALQLWRNFLLICKSDNTAASILGGLAGKLKYFAIEEVNNITATTTIDISQLGLKKEKPIALFIFMSDSDKTFSPIINLTINTIFKRLYKTAYDHKNKLPNPVYFIIEEMANIGKISGMKEMLGTMRGRRIYPMMIWQSLAQMKDVYKDGWENIVSQCDTRVYLGVNDTFTAEYCSKTLGNKTISVNGKSQSNKGLILSSKSNSISYTSRKLMFPEEVMSLKNTKYIITQRANNPALIEKVQYKYWKNKNRICEEREIKETKLIESIKCEKAHDDIRNGEVRLVTNGDNDRDFDNDNEYKQVLKSRGTASRF
ncbi:VirD4-like conjugal transfer protein, CD1115 family [Clostridium sp.]|uniref:VirD4-like conjugal transfer protein, CD1115 family n=1 Tax=Clostridium sp. TaxID=1506 RepID=UPI003F2F7489